jgi:putative SOS response-associated peptidase YedK
MLARGAGALEDLKVWEVENRVGNVRNNGLELNEPIQELF